MTIGVKSFNPNSPGVPEGQPDDEMILAPQWPGFGPGSLVLEGTAYHVGNSSVQRDPFNPAFVRGDGGILVGQFSTEDGAGFTGDMELHFSETGNPYDTQFVSFVHTVDKACFEVVTEQTICHNNGSAFTFAVDGVESCSGSQFSFSFTAAGGAVGQEMCFSVVVNDGQGQECCVVELCTTIPDCNPEAATPFDLNGDGTVGILDMFELFNAWGPCSSCFVPWTCPADFDSDCSVGILDLLTLLANWG